jgi:DNA-binding FadR family transcriptional regulator
MAVQQLDLGPIQVPHAADVLAAELRERILMGTLRPGLTLPAERQLATDTGMSRPTVREAIRLLQAQGLVEVRRGRDGGAVVLELDGRTVVDSVEMLIRGRRVRMESLLETRAAIEPQCATLAALRRTDDDLAALDAANADLEAAEADLPEFLAANVRWHLAVAEASRNELLSAFMRSLSQPLYRSTDDAEFVDVEVRRATLIAHRRVTDAIRAGDAAAAGRRMGSHVSAYSEAVSNLEASTVVELPASRRRPSTPRRRRQP